jgi:hypothetical protein
VCRASAARCDGSVPSEQARRRKAAALLLRGWSRAGGHILGTPSVAQRRASEPADMVERRREPAHATARDHAARRCPIDSQPPSLEACLAREPRRRAMGRGLPAVEAGVPEQPGAEDLHRDVGLEQSAARCPICFPTIERVSVPMRPPPKASTNDAMMPIVSTVVRGMPGSGEANGALPAGSLYITVANQLLAPSTGYGFITTSKW